MSFFLSCGSSSDFSDDVPTNSPPVVSRLDPTTGPVGTEVTIYGLGFSYVAPTNIITMGTGGAVADSYAILSNPTADEIETLTFAVPAGLAPGAYPGRSFGARNTKQLGRGIHGDAMTEFSKERLSKMFGEILGRAALVQEVVKLHGDASYRTYYRAVLDDKKSYILMQMPEGRASASEEITNFNGSHKELPFINVARFLKDHGVNVPAVHRYFEDDHIMILEDLGDNLMAKIVETAGEGVRKIWYERAIDLLVELQKKTSVSHKFECVALQRSFDATLLNWEFDHFLEYGIEERLSRKMAAADRDLFVNQTRNISDAIPKLPYGFTHRDFQSRNILIVNNELYLIDFQDALLGPAAYDLVSLLRDSYVKLSEKVSGELIDYYCGKKGLDLELFRREFDLVTCQRKLKDAGRFVYIDRVKKNPNFLKYIPTSLGYVKSAFERLPEYSVLYDMLKKYVPEWN